MATDLAASLCGLRRPMRWLGVAVCLALPLPALPVYVLQSFTMPGADSTQVWDISNSGQIVGNAYSATQGWAFVYDAGIWRTLPLPVGAVQASAIGISDNGLVASGWWDAAGVHHSSLFSLASNSYLITDLQVPSVGQGAVNVRGISPDGRFLTGYVDTVSRGFVYDRQTQQVVGTIDSNPPGGLVIAQGVNSAGQVVGSARNNGVNNAFIYDLPSATQTYFAFPGYSTAARAINDNGLMAGFATPKGTDAPVTIGWVGTTGSFEAVSGPNGAALYFQGINNLGQVVGYTLDANGESRAFIGTPAHMPASTAGEVHSFNIAVSGDQPVFIDPLVAVGYTYSVGAGDPLFKTVSLPVGVGDNLYTLMVGGQSFTLHGNEIFDFTAHGFAGGVETFEITGIEPEAQVDPANPQAFATRLTFMGSGAFTGTQTALTQDYSPSPVPEPATVLLWLAGLAALAMRHVRNQAVRLAPTPPPPRT